MITHRSLANHLAWFQRTFRLDETEKCLQLAPLSFDVSICEMLAPLVCGGQLVIPRPGSSGDIAYLIDTILEKQITLLQVVPVLLQTLLQEPLFQSCSSIRQVISGGEELPGELAARFYEISDARLYNLYGPTECNIDALHWPVPSRVDLPVAPIGSPVDNIQAYILNAGLQPVPVGVQGELYLAGEGLARGYLNAPKLTAERFIPNLFAETAAQAGSRLYRTGDRARYLPDGSVEFLGRLDDQVKIRGFRIELGEIEAALRVHPNVRQAVVCLRQDLPGEKRLAAYLVLETDSDYGESGLRAYLKTRLPPYMLPASFTTLDTLPLNTSGKVDRRALLDLEPGGSASRENFVLPRTPVEQVVAGIWTELLGVAQVGIYDNFFDLGGHSLLAIKLNARIQEIFAVSLSLGMIFEAPVVALYCEKILQTSGDPTKMERIARLVLQVAELSEGEASSWLKSKSSSDKL
jgi:acyl-coenzyme A synthetase/AMP-(fatty) acid ligase